MYIISLVIQVLQFMIFADAILTWIPQIDRRNPIVVLLRSITTPILAPIRKLVPPRMTGQLDLSPLIAIVGLSVLDSLLRFVI